MIDEIKPIELPCRDLRAREVENRPGQIEGRRDLAAGGPGLDPSGPAHDERYADAAFKGGALGATERAHVRGPGEAAVVGDENHQGVFLELVLLQGRQHAADLTIEIFEHCYVGFCIRFGPV